MATSPKQVRDAMAKYTDPAILSSAVSGIDRYLTDQNWVMKNREKQIEESQSTPGFGKPTPDHEDNEKYFWKMSFQGGFMPKGVIEEIIRIYTEAGWAKVEHTTHQTGDVFTFRE